jgi:hypothetical protein
VKEIVIYNLNEGIFYAKLICEKEGQLSEIDARTSDAIALGVRFKCPIYTYENILASAGVELDENSDFASDFEEELEKKPAENSLNSLSIEELQQKLQAALEEEEYELASKIRDEISKRSEN